MPLRYILILCLLFQLSHGARETKRPRFGDEITVSSETQLRGALEKLTAGQTLVLDTEFLTLSSALSISEPRVTVRSREGTKTRIRCANSDISAFKILAQGVKLTGLTIEQCGRTAVSVEAHGSEMILLQSVSFVDNRLSSYRGRGGGLAVTNTGNGLSVHVKNCVFESNGAFHGGAIWVHGVDLTLRNCQFLKNDAKGGAGAVAIAGARASLEIRGCRFEENRVTERGRNDELTHPTGLPIEPSRYVRFPFPSAIGGAVAADSIQKTVIESSVFLNNTATAGGALAVLASATVQHSCEKGYEPTVQLTDCQFRRNFAESPKQGDDTLGGAVYAASAAASFRWSMERCTFEENRAQHGGAVHMVSLLVTDPRFTDCTFRRNNATAHGGAIVLRNTGSASFKQCTFDQNTADEIGGAILATNNAMLLIRGLSGLSPRSRVGVPTTFTQNHAAHGGALACIGCSDMGVRDAIFVGNSAERMGGGVLVWDADAYIEFTQCRFEHNRAETGGGAAIVAAEDVRFGVVHPSLKNTFRGNQASAGAGLHYSGTHMRENRLRIVRTEFEQHRSEQTESDVRTGGVLDLVLDRVPSSAYVDVLVNDVNITDNQVQRGGGATIEVDGVWNRGDDAPCDAVLFPSTPCRRLKFINVEVTHNTAREAPGLFVTAGRALAIGCEVYDEAMTTLSDVYRSEARAIDTHCALIDQNFITGTTEELNIQFGEGST